MKKRNLCIFSGLAISAFALGACSPKAPAHTHDLVKVNAKAATCLNDGNTEYYKCSDCEKLFSDQEAANEITLESTIVTKLGHKFADPTYAWNSVTRVCTATKECERCDYTYSEDGTMTSTVKSVATCTGEGVTTYTATFTDSAFETQSKDYLDPALDHDLADFEILGDLVTKDYVSGQKLSLEGLTFTGTCSRGDSVSISPSEITIKYENGGDTLLAGETCVNLKYKIWSKVLSFNEVAKMPTTITISDTYNIKCGERFDESQITSNVGSVALAYVDKNGDVVSGQDLVEELSPYTVTAVVTGTSEYEGATKSAVINVTHDFESGAVCNCGVKSVENVYIGLTDTGYELYLDQASGLYADFVKNPAAEWFNADGTAELVVTAANAGTEIDAVVVVGEEAVKVRATVCSKLIRDVETLKQAMNMWYAPKGEEGGDHGYYLLLNDILNAGNLGEIKVANEFSGTFDGNGHTISGFNAWGYGFFGDAKNATVKNVKLLAAKNNRLFRQTHGEMRFENFEYNLAGGYTVCGAGAIMQSFDGQLIFDGVVLSGLDKATDVAIAAYDWARNMPQFTNTVIKCHPDVKLVNELSDYSRTQHGDLYGDNFRPQLEGLTYIDSVGIEVNETILVDIARQEFDFSEVTKDLTGWTISNVDGATEMDWDTVNPGEGKITVRKAGEKALTYNVIYASTIIKTAADFESLKCPNGASKETVRQEGYWILGNDISNVVMETTVAEVATYCGLASGASPAAADYLNYAKAHTFAGTIDGRGHTITGLTVSCHTYIGMFGGISNGATFKNLNIDGLKSGWGANGGNYQIYAFGYNVMSTTFENMNIKLAAATGAYAGSAKVGIFGSECGNRVTMKNVNVDLNNLKNASATYFAFFASYGASDVYSAVTESITVTNLFEGYTMYFAYSKGSNGVLDLTTCTGFTSPLM